MEQLIATIQSLNIDQEYKDLLLKEVKAAEKKLAVMEFKYNRTIMDKAAITNVLNTTIEEIEKQKKIIELAKNEIAQNLAELDKQKRLVEEKNSELAKTLRDLEATQAQLIQSEKMASLGELTAGIAHEIQNPLNFVNNFSDINTELIEELKEVRARMNGEINKTLENEILDNIEQNFQKILYHGKRADNIVKSMLQHSTKSIGQKEWTHLNTLVDGALRLSYHGMKAKDKELNVNYITHFDGSIGKLNVIPQDISRVFLNLLNNAFYAVHEKRETAGEKYEPTVWVTTKRINYSSKEGCIIVSIKDSGTGIPQNIIDKIFQPFFTTKPTGQGTGLGLSLSYDIIKAHGGDIKVESKEGEGSEFIISLPLIA